MFSRVLFSALIVFSLTDAVNSQVLINEIQSSNVITLKDEFNEYPDWIELINTTSEIVNLQGWCLSDDKNLLAKWCFPQIQLLPSQPLLVCASGRDIKQAPSYWHTVIDAGAEWKYILPGDTVSTDWKAPAYSDIDWLTGNSGFGYGDNDDNTSVLEGTVSIYTRKTFNLSALDNISSILLHVDFDDGFVAYLNGVEVARTNLGEANSDVTYDQLAVPDHEAMMYQGLQPVVFDISAYKNSLVIGENILAVEIHNSSTTSSDLSLITFLTFGKTSVGDVSELPSPLLLLGNKFPHTNFKIKSGGEVVILSNPAGHIADSITPPAMQQDFSFGRLSGNINQFSIFDVATPGGANPDSGLNVLADDKINYSVPGGFHSAGFSVQLSSSAVAPIYFTTDGSEPDSTSSLYTSAINISGNTVLKSRIIKEGYLIGRTYAATYVTEHASNMPITCLSTLPSNLWDYNTGMYVMGPNASSGYPYFGANFWMDWEKPFCVEIYNTSGKCIINQVAGASIFGAWSRARKQKSFAIAARKSYGDSDFDYPLFVTQPSIDKYKSFVLRNSGNDWDLAFMRDVLITDLTSKLGVEHQAFQPTATYLNGEYWGIYDMREKVNENFIAEHWHVNPDNVTILLNDAEVIAGDNTEYIQLRNYLNSNVSLAEADKYKYVSDRIDIDNFIKYQLIQIYVDNRDWPGNNIKYWKTSDPQSKWRWILYDTDFGFGLYNSESFRDNTLSFALDPNGPGWPNPAWSTLLFRRLITNTDFKNDFIIQMCDNINTTFESSNVESRVDSIYNLYKTEMPFHKIRWGQSFDSWRNEVIRIKSWASYRPEYMQDFLFTTFELQGYSKITLNVSGENQGTIRLNSITPNSYPFLGTYFYNIPIEMEAIPAPGYKFVGWEGQSTSTDRLISYTPTGDATFTAKFEAATADDINLTINEINYNSSVDWPSGDWVEIYNKGAATVDLSGCKLSDSNQDSGYVFSDGSSLAPDKYLVVTKNSDNFRRNYPYVNNVIGDFIFGLSSLGDEIRLYDALGKILDAVDYLSTSPWPIEANGTGITLELKNPDLDNTKPENWVAVKQYGTPGAVNSMLTDILEPKLNISSNGIITAFPNKFSDYTTISFTLPSSGKVKIDVIDLQGIIIENLVDGYFPAGDNYTDWSPESLIGSGMYIIRLISGTYIDNINVVYIK
jgi:uncharacterized repeat protein (TIGR02543 family)